MPTAAAPVVKLRELAQDNFITSEHKLMQLARRKGVVVNQELAKQALKSDVGKQVFARAPRSVGKSAATQPGTYLQADLIDFSKNTAQKGYAEVIADVFTRKVYAKAIANKDADTVEAATKDLLKQVPGHGQDASFSTDQGGEWATVGDAGVINRQKINGEVNSIAVVDRRIQELKKMLARDATSKKDYNWKTGLRPVVNALNDNYTAAVHGAPDDVGPENIQTFFVEQDNADKFMDNRDLQDKRKAALEEAGAYRAPIGTGGRSFKPGYGEVREFAGVAPGGRFVVDSKGRRNLLSLAQPVAKGSAEAQGSLTLQTKYVPRPSALEKHGAGKPMRKQIPLAAGQPVEGPRHRVRLGIKTSKAKKAKKAEAPEEPAEGRSSSSTGPNLLVEGRPEKKVDFIKAQILAHEPKNTKAELKARAQQKEEQRQQETAARKAARAAQTAANQAARKAERDKEVAFNKGLREAEKRLKQQGHL